MKKFIQSKVFRESGADAVSAIGQRSDRPTINTRRQIAFKAWLESEADAAAIINAMSFCVGHKSDLAIKARNYASKLMLYVERINGLLPPDARGRYSALSFTSRGNPALTPKSAEQAAFVLTEYLLHHTDETDKIALPALASPQAEAGERLIRKLHDERHDLAEWIRTSAHNHNRRATSPEEQESASFTQGEARQAQPSAEAAGSIRKHDVSATSSMCHDTSRLFYNPRQTVRWM